MYSLCPIIFHTEPCEVMNTIVKLLGGLMVIDRSLLLTNWTTYLWVALKILVLIFTNITYHLFSTKILVCKTCIILSITSNFIFLICSVLKFLSKKVIIIVHSVKKKH